MLIEEIIKSKITKNGAITTAEFMELWLSHPEYGYYRCQKPLGKHQDSDFITAPEICSAFSEMIAIWLARVFTSLFSDNRQISIIELGGGNGILMQDFLKTIRKIAPEFFNILDVKIIDIGIELIKNQKEILQDFLHKITWFATFEDAIASQNCPIFIIANEFFDALPIEQFAYNNATGNWHQRMVSLQNGNFCFTFGRKLSTSEEWQLLPILPQNTLGVTPTNIPKNAIIEKSFHMEKIVQSIASSIKTHRGAGIFIDYGYFTTRGNSNRTNATKTANINSDMLLNPASPLKAFNSSLQAVKNHHKQHIFKDVGKADITSLVNFADIAKIFQNHNISYKFETQRDFLLANGILQRMDSLKNRGLKEAELAINRLINKQEMGEFFKSFTFIE